MAVATFPASPTSSVRLGCWRTKIERMLNYNGRMGRHFSAIVIWCHCAIGSIRFWHMSRLIKIIKKTEEKKTSLTI